MGLRLRRTQACAALHSTPARRDLRRSEAFSPRDATIVSASDLSSVRCNAAWIKKLDTPCSQKSRSLVDTTGWRHNAEVRYDQTTTAVALFVSAKGTSMSRRRNERRPHAYTLQRGYTGAAKVAPSAPSVNSHHQDTFLQLPGIHYTEPCRSQQMLPSTAVRTPKVVVHQQHTTIPVYL